MMTPLVPRPIMRLAASWELKNSPFQSMAVILSKSASSASRKYTSLLMPALFTTRSIPSNAWSAWLYISFISLICDISA